jgi:transposase
MATTAGQDRLVEVASVVASAAECVPVGVAKAFRAYDPDQVLLMSPVLGEWVPEGDLAHFVSDLVEDALDLSVIYASYESERGYPPYDPRLMVKLLVYGYANGVCSSRKLERATHRDVAIRMLCAGQHPDYRSIARFRARHLDALSELFVQALRLCSKAGLVKLGSLALDGTKLRANASRRKAMSYERMAKKESQLEPRSRGFALARVHCSKRLRRPTLPRTSFTVLACAATNCRRGSLVARRAWPGCARPRRRLRSRRGRVRRRAAKRCAPRAESRVTRPGVGTRLRPSQPRSATSPMPTRRS